MGVNAYVKIGNRIRKLREKKGYTQKQLAEFAGIPYSTYSNYENNNREPGVEQIEKIAAALEISTDELLGYKKAIDSETINLIENINNRIFRLLTEKDKLSTEQINRDQNYDPCTEQARADYAAESDMTQFRLKRTVEDLEEFKTVLTEAFNTKTLSIHYEILFSLIKLNYDGELRILEEIENLLYNPKYQIPLKPNDWDPYADI